jgi:predicted  nucleic acid-binding Zn-ribbon protein
MLAARGRLSREAKESLEVAKEKRMGFQAHLKTLELDLADREGLLQKANGNLMSAKSNQEYTLLIAEINRKTEEKGTVEESILEQYDVIAVGDRMVIECEARLREAEEDYLAFQKRALEELDAHRAELAIMDGRRAQVIKAISPDPLQIYERAHKALGNAIVPAEGKTCQGCFSTLTPNDNNLLHSSKRIIICRQCQRILYLPEVIEPTSA